jgi:hypothetical protein
VLDIGVTAIVEQTSLYVNATFAQPALRVQGAAVGIVVFSLAVVVVLVGLSRAYVRDRVIEWTWLDIGMASIVPLAVVGAAIGLVNANKPVFIVGDTYKLLVVSAAYCVVRVTCRHRHEAEKLFVGIAVLALAVGVLQAVKILSRLAEGAQLNGVGAPPLIGLAGALAATALWQTSWRRRWATATALAAMLLLTFLSMTRGLWVVMAVMVLAAVLAAPHAMVRRAGPPFLLTALLMATLVAVPTPVSAQLQNRLSEVTRQGPAVATLMPPADLVSSLDERRWEIQDSLVELSRHGMVAAVFGRGSGAEYPTALDRIEDTSDEGHRHQIHVTWVSVLYRHGILGLLVLVGVLSAAAIGLLRAVRRAGGFGPDLTGIVLLGLGLWLLGAAIDLTDAYGFFGDVAWGVLLAVTALVSSRMQLPSEAVA